MDGAQPSNDADQPIKVGGSSEAGSAPMVDFEFEVVSYIRPRAIRLRRASIPEGGSGVPDGGSAATEDVAIVLWAYYEACRRGTTTGRTVLPWKRPRGGRRWRTFCRLMLSDPNRSTWWGDPVRRAKRAKDAFRESGHRSGP